MPVKNVICPPECKERSATCHATCERYLAAYEKNRQMNDERFQKNKGFYNSLYTMKQNTERYYNEKYKKK